MALLWKKGVVEKKNVVKKAHFFLEKLSYAVRMSVHPSSWLLRGEKGLGLVLGLGKNL